MLATQWATSAFDGVSGAGGFTTGGAVAGGGCVAGGSGVSGEGGVAARGDFADGAGEGGFASGRIRMLLSETSELEEASEVIIGTGRLGAAGTAGYGHSWLIAFAPGGTSLRFFIISLPNLVSPYPPT